jgi:hypothetical protein
MDITGNARLADDGDEDEDQGGDEEKDTDEDGFVKLKERSRVG